MTGPYCERCQTQVRLDSDGKSCSNCGRALIGPVAQTDPAAETPTANPANPPADPPHPKTPTAKKRGARTSQRPTRSAA